MRNKIILTVVMALAVVPMAVAVLMYAVNWRPAATVNVGELIVPVRPIADHVLQTLDGKTMPFSKLHGKWTMLYFDSSACAEACVKNLYLMRQTQIAQGKESDRVQRVFVVTDTAAVPALTARLAEYPGMYVLTGDEKSLAELARNFGIAEGQLAQQHSVYLIDPQGNLMMRYAPDVDPAGVRKDLKRLLEYSWMG